LCKKKKGKKIKQFSLTIRIIYRKKEKTSEDHLQTGRGGGKENPVRRLTSSYVKKREKNLKRIYKLRER